MDNNDIRIKVEMVVNAFLNKADPKKQMPRQELKLVWAGADLVVNLLQNFNDIAARCRDEDRP